MSITALVGLDTNDKSALCALLMSIYKPDRGQILIDNDNINEYNIKDLHQHHISIIDQNPILFTGTVAENISYGQQTATTKEIINAAKLANAHGFICKLQNGYNTHIDPQQSKLSNTQIQLIAIARAFLINPEILIIYEPLLSQAIIDNALHKICQNRTILLITNRLSTLQNADKIVVMQHGTIIQQGTHTQLIQDQQSLYYLLYKNYFS